MNLNTEAIICLRTPLKSGLPIPPGYANPTISFLTGPRWGAALTSLPLSTYDRTPPPRDAQFQLQIDPVAKTYTSTETWVDPADKPDPLEVEVRPRTSVARGKVLDTGDAEAANTAEQQVSQFQQDGPEGRGWEVLAWGKQGQLESWMKEDPGSGLILDDSGEGRPDWRNSYVVVYYEATAEREAAVEVWDSYAKWRRLTDQTFRKIQSAMRRSMDRELANLGDRMVRVKWPKPYAA